MRKVWHHIRCMTAPAFDSPTLCRPTGIGFGLGPTLNEKMARKWKINWTFNSFSLLLACRQQKCNRSLWKIFCDYRDKILFAASCVFWILYVQRKWFTFGSSISATEAFDDPPPPPPQSLSQRLCSEKSKRSTASWCLRLLWKTSIWLHSRVMIKCTLYL